MHALNDQECELLKGGDSPRPPQPGGPMPPTMMPPGSRPGGLSINISPVTNVSPVTDVTGPTVNTSIATVIQQNVAATIAVINSRAASAQANGNTTRI
jgi:hypothetical protein